MSDPFGPYGTAGRAPSLSPFTPGGYATLVSGSPVFATDQASKTIVYYTQDAHNAFPVIKNGTRHAVYFDEPRLVLSTAHLASTIYDVFGVERNGRGHLVSGPAWATVTAGAGARGTGGGTPELARAGGALVNRWGIPGLNADGPQFIAPGEGCYLFSIFIDAVAGQVTCHCAYGQSRKFGIWNAHNRRLLYLKGGDPTASWSYPTAVVRASNNAAANSLTLFSGLAEEFYDLRFRQRVDLTHPNNLISGAENGMGINSTTVMSGGKGRAGIGNTTAGMTYTVRTTVISEFEQPPLLGVNVVTALENGIEANGTITWFGTADYMRLSAKWRG